MSRHQHPLTSVAAHASPAGTAGSSGAGADARNTLTFDQLTEGTGFPTGKLTGSLKLLYAPKPEDDELHLDFAIKVKLAASSDYVQSKQHRRSIMARFVLLPSPTDDPALVAQTRDANYDLLKRSLGSTLTVDCAGAKVVERRAMGDKTPVVKIRATGSRAVTIDGTRHEFLKCERPKPPERSRTDDWFSPSPAPTVPSAPPTRPTTTAQAELTRGDVTRHGAVPTMRPLSAVPQFTLKTATKAAHAQSLAHEHASASASASAPRGSERRSSLLPLAAPAPAPAFATAAADTSSVTQNMTDAVRPPPTAVDISSHGHSVAPRHAPASPPQRPLLPSPSTVLSSRPETIDSPPSSMELAKGESSSAAKLNLDPPRGDPRAHGQWSVSGTRPTEMSENSEIEDIYFPDKQLSAIEMEAKRRSAAALQRAGDAEGAEERGVSDSTAAIAHRPDATESRSVAANERERLRQTDGAMLHESHPQREKRPREDTAESPAQVVAQKKARIDGKEQDNGPPVAALDPRREAETRAAAEVSALRMRQAQLREAEAALAQRRADAETLHRGLQVHGRSIPRTYVTLREAASRSSANVAAVIVDVKGMRTTPTGDRSLTVVIADPSSHTQGNASDDMVVTLFRKTEAPLQLLSAGMPILFRALKITTYNNKAKGQMYSNGSCVLYALRDGEVITTDTSGEGLSPAEVERLQQLQQWWADNGEAPATTNVAVGDSNRGRQDVELGAIKEGQYFQLTGKILDMQLNTRGGNFPKYELYIADGTVSGDEVRDFHGVGSRYPWLPRGSIFTLAVQNDPVGPAFVPGQIVRFPNVRVKRYAGQLELIWSDKVTLQQERDGWKSRRHFLVPASEERAVVIEKRLKDWKRGRVPEGQADPRYMPQYEPEEVKPDPEPEQRVIATHLKTIHTDPILHQPSPSLLSMRENLTVPNRYRILVRVRDLIGRGARGSRPDDLAVLWCRKCARAFPDNHCKSCEDTGYKHAELRWQFVLLLADEVGGELVAVMSDPQVTRILPSLPSLSHETSSGIGKLRATTIPSLRSKVENILQGAMFDGTRTRPWIDMTLESFVHVVQGDEVVGWRVFGMETA